MSLPGELRRRIEEFVGPLYAGLDGEQSFDRVARVEERMLRLSDGEPAEVELLELLALFHGAVDRLGSLGPEGRLALVLGSFGVEAGRVRRLRAGLGRFRRDPRSREEELLHDAVLLEECGVAAVARRMLEAGRRRRPLDKVVDSLDPGPAAERFRTPRARAAAARERQRAEEWIDGLRRAVSGVEPSLS